MIPRWHLVPNLDAWLSQARAFVLAKAASAIAERGVFHLALAGGETPRKLYALLARDETQDWSRWHLWLGDERCLPPDDPARNSVMVQAAWLDFTPAAHFHPIPAELGSEAAAAAYCIARQAQPAFDLALLGLGEDGHTASLFPGQDWGEHPDTPAALAIRNAPKPPAARVSLSARQLSDSHAVLFLISGAGKRAAVTQWAAGDVIPASAIEPRAGCDALLTADATPDFIFPGA
mgnify:CR=1 FL=1